MASKYRDIPINKYPWPHIGYFPEKGLLHFHLFGIAASSTHIHPAVPRTTFDKYEFVKGIDGETDIAVYSSLPEGFGKKTNN